MKRTMVALAMVSASALIPAVASAQGVPGGIERGAREGERIGGPVGAVVGGTVGGVVGGVAGVLGVDQRPRFHSYVVEQRRPSYRYQNELATTAASLKSIGKQPHLGSLDKLTENVAALESAIEKLEAAVGHKGGGDLLAHAKHFRDEVIPTMNVVRAIADKIETIVPDDIWPLPSYHEMLFIK